MNENEGYWGGGISIISQNFPKSPSIFFHPLDYSISQTSPECCLDLLRGFVVDGEQLEETGLEKSWRMWIVR
jgi:hypothetical protein